jgi:uncharacterized membrane protein
VAAHAEVLFGVNPFKLPVPFHEVVFEIVVILLVLVIVQRSVEHVSAVVIAVTLLVQDDVTIALEVLIPKIFDHLSTSLALECVEIMRARELLTEAVGDRIIEGFRQMLFSYNLLQVVLGYHDVPLACQNFDLVKAMADVIENSVNQRPVDAKCAIFHFHDRDRVALVGDAGQTGDLVDLF